MSLSRELDVATCRELARAVEAFGEALEAWLELFDDRPDLRLTGRRPTVRPRADADPDEIERRAAAVRDYQDAAAVAIDVAGTHLPAGVNLAREWAGMAAKGAKVNPDAARYTPRSTRRVLEFLVERFERHGGAVPLLPVPDPTVLHRHVWWSPVVNDWLQDKYTSIPNEIPLGAVGAWGQRLDHPARRGADTLWQVLLSPDPPAERQPRLRIPDTGDPETTATRQAALLHALDAMQRLGRTYHDAPTPIGPEQVAGWLHTWTHLLTLLDQCTILPATPEPDTPTPPPPAPPTDTTPAAPGAITVDDTVFAPIPHPDYPEIHLSAHETVRVTTTAPDEHLAHALATAAARLCLVDSEGTEHPDLDTMNNEASHLHTPSWAQVLTDTDGHPFLYVDCQSAIPEPMGATMRRILTDELARTIPDGHAHPLDHDPNP
ncbi:hypothetical protein JQN72_03450 [Phycicoccus sp. CSK15P-2]|uniref:hypothetical protein n=1 Tax=Phycicoccus sp. CSK15P-2 TaxID=2807627 RepID=UPI001950D84B|nr:hypothetical protein [Phycicoccus sp. CSK15P-2]MBM6403301.1 hypothetical protein [Phycicoccus sp. CSK15P-2]